MFDSGMMEWLVIVMVALLVLGPQRCMTLLKMLGLMLGKAKAVFADVQRQVSEELPNEELQALDQQVKRLRTTNIRRRALELMELDVEKKQG